MASFLVEQYIEILVAYRPFSLYVSFSRPYFIVRYLGCQGQFWTNSSNPHPSLHLSL